MQVDAAKDPDTIFSAICDIFETLKRKDKASVAAAQN